MSVVMSIFHLADVLLCDITVLAVRQTYSLIILHASAVMCIIIIQIPSAMGSHDSLLMDLLQQRNTEQITAVKVLFWSIMFFLFLQSFTDACSVYINQLKHYIY